MMHAADEGRVDVVKLLLDRGAKIEAVDKVSINGQSRCLELLPSVLCFVVALHESDSTITTIAHPLRLNLLHTLYPLFCLYSGRIHGLDRQCRRRKS